MYSVWLAMCSVWTRTLRFSTYSSIDTASLTYFMHSNAPPATFPEAVTNFALSAAAVGGLAEDPRPLSSHLDTVESACIFKVSAKVQPDQALVAAQSCLVNNKVLHKTSCAGSGQSPLQQQCVRYR